MCHKQKEENQKNNEWFEPSGCLGAKESQDITRPLWHLPDTELQQGGNRALGSVHHMATRQSFREIPVWSPQMHRTQSDLNYNGPYVCPYPNAHIWQKKVSNKVCKTATAKRNTD